MKPEKAYVVIRHTNDDYANCSGSYFYGKNAKKQAKNWIRYILDHPQEFGFYAPIKKMHILLKNQNTSKIISEWRWEA